MKAIRKYIGKYWRELILHLSSSMRKETIRRPVENEELSDHLFTGSKVARLNHRRMTA
ncbi:MAG: hypothetical protein JNK14_20465 [Chitinophagaceae bacterium]|nr:hypothetical protein [Chitinophagaceae bacterium]